MKIELPNADIDYIDNFYSAKEALQLYYELTQSLAWREDTIRMFGKLMKVPRLQALYSDNNSSYRYSNMTLTSTPFTPTLTKIKQRLGGYCQEQFNTVLANLYRNEKDSVSWHSDDESELGTNPVIASLSFGAERDFQLKHIQTKEKLSIRLASGSLLLMKGTTQHYWQHCVPKRSKSIGPRINLTFRKICS